MRTLKLNFNISLNYVGAVLALADAWSAANGLSRTDSARLRMAAEEFSSYLAAVFAGEEAAVEFGEYGRRVFVEFSFSGSNLDLSALNMVNIHEKGEKEVSADTSLMLARLSADNFTLTADARGRFALRAYLEKSYTGEAPQPAWGESVRPFVLSQNGDTLHAALLMAAGRDSSFAQSLYARSPKALTDDLAACAVKALWAEDGA